MKKIDLFLLQEGVEHAKIREIFDTYQTETNTRDDLFADDRGQVAFYYVTPRALPYFDSYQTLTAYANYYDGFVEYTTSRK